MHNSKKINIDKSELQKIKSFMRLKQLLKERGNNRTLQENNQVASILPILEPFTYFEDSAYMQDICKRIELKTLQEGQVLFTDVKSKIIINQQSLSRKFMYVILLGEAGVYEILKNGDSVIQRKTKTFRQGEHFWYDMLIEFNNQTIQVQANEETDFICLQKTLYDYLLQESRNASQQLLRKFLQGHSLFQRLSGADLHELVGSFTLQHVEANTLMVRQGDNPMYLYIVLGGTFKVVRKMNGGESKLYDVAELWKGDCFCMQSILTNMPIGYSVVSSVGSEVLRSERQNIQRYDSYLSYSEIEEGYTQDSIFAEQLQQEKQWERYKQIQMKQLFQEKIFQKSKLVGLLRSDYNLVFKKQKEFVKVQHTSQRYRSFTLPPVVQ